MTQGVLPAGSCDAHLHIIPEAPETALPCYVAMRVALGLSRAVVVQAKAHGTDNTATLEAVAGLGAEARGIAVLHPGMTTAELRRLHDGGIRGLRFSLWRPSDAVCSLEMIEPLAAAIAPLGWHVQLHLSGAQISDMEAMLDRLPCPIVFDHMGRLPPAEGAAHPAFAVMARLLQRGRAWVKLGGAYLNTGVGPPYPDASRIARALVAEAPERLVWGTDWPHVTERDKPDDAGLLALLDEWAGSAEVRDRILVENPAKLYGFVQSCA